MHYLLDKMSPSLKMKGTRHIEAHSVDTQGLSFMRKTQNILINNLPEIYQIFKNCLHFEVDCLSTRVSILNAKDLSCSTTEADNSVFM